MARRNAGGIPSTMLRRDLSGGQASMGIAQVCGGHSEHVLGRSLSTAAGPDLGWLQFASFDFGPPPADLQRGLQLGNRRSVA